MKSILTLVVVLLLVSPAVLAEKPDPNVPNPPVQVLEWNVDEDGFIRVHEQGTASVDIIDTEELDVNVTGGQIDANITNEKLTVDVDNWPSVQDVYIIDGRLASVNEVWADIINTGNDGNVVRDFGRTIDTTHITVSITDQEGPDGDSEFQLMFYSPLVPGGFTGEPVLRMIDYSADLLYETQTFSYPVPLNGLRLVCANEAEDCNVAVTVFGFTGD